MYSASKIVSYTESHQQCCIRDGWDEREREGAKTRTATPAVLPAPHCVPPSPGECYREYDEPSTAPMGIDRLRLCEGKASTKTACSGHKIHRRNACRTT